MIFNAGIGIPKPTRGRGGRKPRPPRCVIQLRHRANGKVCSIYSITVNLKIHEAMKRLQEMFHDCRIQ